MTPEFKKKIIDSIKKGGWSTELRAAEILQSKNWLTISNYIYYDQGKNIAREIDLHCQKSSDYKLLKEFEVKITLIIEVKKSTNLWVFFIGKSEDPIFTIKLFLAC